jgi:hypothetical protein
VEGICDRIHLDHQTANPAARERDGVYSARIKGVKQ